MKRKLSALLLSAALILSMVTPAFAAGPPPDGNWYAQTMRTWADRGIIQGDASGDLKPTAEVTRGEMAVILDRIMRYESKAANIFSDVESGAWYADAILGANEAGIIMGSDNLARPEDKITRQEATVMLARVMDLDSGAFSAGFSDQDAIAPWAVDAVNAMAAAGYIKGSRNAFRPTANITRAEVLTILDNMFRGYFAAAGSYDGDVPGSAVISAGGVTLSNMNISGDLIIAEGVADGDVVLDNVTVGGNVIVRGGGENSIHFRGSKTQVTNVKLEKNGNVRLATDGQAEVGNVFVKDKSKEVKLEGTYNSVTVSSSNTVSVQQADITLLSIEIRQAHVKVGPNSNLEQLEMTGGGRLEIHKAATVKKLTVSQGAYAVIILNNGTIVNALISGKADFNNYGSVSRMEIDSADVQYKGNKPESVTVADGIEFSMKANNAVRYDDGDDDDDDNDDDNDDYITTPPPVVSMYTVTIDPNIVNGTVSANPMSGSAGTVVTVTATPNDPVYKLGSVTIGSNSYPANSDGTYKFRIKNHTTISATFVPADAEIFTISVAQAKNGSIEVIPPSAYAGTEITIVARPNANYELLELKINGARVTVGPNNTYTFILDSNTTVSASFGPVGVQSFTVNFDSDGGTNVASQLVSAGGKASRPHPDPTMPDCRFAGWYRDADCTQEWRFDTDVVTGNITLYAKWTDNPAVAPSVTVSAGIHNNQNITHQGGPLSVSNITSLTSEQSTPGGNVYSLRAFGTVCTLRSGENDSGFSNHSSDNPYVLSLSVSVNNAPAEEKLILVDGSDPTFVVGGVTFQVDVSGMGSVAAGSKNGGEADGFVLSRITSVTYDSNSNVFKLNGTYTATTGPGLGAQTIYALQVSFANACGASGESISNPIDHNVAFFLKASGNFTNSNEAVILVDPAQLASAGSTIISVHIGQNLSYDLDLSGMLTNLS